MFALMTTQRAVGYVVIAIVAIGGFFFVWTQIRKGRKEAGAEVELAANRKLYLDDEQLETKKLNLALWSAFGLLLVVGVTLPLYWLAEGGRQVGAVKTFNDVFVTRGEKIYTEEAKCVGCHGPEGTGGAASFVITNERGEFVQQVNWSSPALDTVLWRYSQAEVKDVLLYGRPGSPMAAWGVIGGGALSDQQLDNVIDYLWSVQISPDEMRKQVGDALEARDPGLKKRLDAVHQENVDKKLADTPLVYECPSKTWACLSEADNLRLGEIVFGLHDVAAGAYSCSRCHVPGASFGQDWKSVEVTGRGQLGPSLIGIEENLTIGQHYQLIMRGSEFGKLYGANKQGSGRMPGLGSNANFGDPKVPQLGTEGMLTPEEVWAIVVYERNLSVERPDLRRAAAPAPAEPTPATAASAPSPAN